MKHHKSDYEMEPANENKELTYSWSTFWYNIEQWFNSNHEKLFDWFIRIILTGLIFLALFGISDYLEYLNAPDLILNE